VKAERQGRSKENCKRLTGGIRYVELGVFEHYNDSRRNQWYI